MMRTGLLLIGTAMCLLIAGCDGDGDGSTAQPAMPAQGGMDLSGATWVLGQSTETATTGQSVVLRDFDITEPGLLEVTVTWDSGPATMNTIVVRQLSAAAHDTACNAVSPVELSVQVTQAIIDQDTAWQLIVSNTAGPDTPVHYTIYFTPDS